MTISTLTSLTKKAIAIVYHSSFGHTRKVAEAVLAGASHSQNPAAITAKALDIDTLTEVDWAFMDGADMLVFGSAVYMGSMTGKFKLFMDDTSKRWYHRQWQGKWAASFVNSGGLSGDKLAVLQQINLFAMQHGMLWAGLPLMPTGKAPTDLNRLSGFLGLMTQSDNASPDVTPPQGDLDTAYWFGQYLANLLLTGQPPHLANEKNP